MKSSRIRRASILAVPLVIAATWTATAMAQGAPPPAPPGPPPPPAAAPAPAEPAPPPAPAPVKYPTTTITGLVDTAYHKVLESGGNGTVLTTRSYDTANGFQLHAAHLAIKH